jgi:hypothetical protein
MTNERRRYIAYLVRLWRPGSAQSPAWRASVEDPHSGAQRTFADLASLFAFLEEQTGVDAGHAEQVRPPADAIDLDSSHEDGVIV